MSKQYIKKGYDLQLMQISCNPIKTIEEMNMIQVMEFNTV